MEPSSEIPNFCSVQRPVPCPSATTTASSIMLKSSGTTAFEASMFIIPDMESTRKGKDQREQGKGKREKKHPHDEDATKGEVSAVAAPKPRSKQCKRGGARAADRESQQIRSQSVFSSRNRVPN